MSAIWKNISARFMRLKQRERMLVLIASVAVIGFSYYNLLLKQPLEQQKKLQSQINTAQTGLKTLQQQIAIIQTSPILDPDQESRNKLSILQKQAQEIDTKLKQLQNTLISPEQMAAALKDILLANNKLKLISLKTLDISEIEISAANEQTNTKKTVLYKHGIEINVSGRYFELQEYLSSLEKLPWHFMWGKVELQSLQYPESTLIVTLYTLSLDKAWLSL